jgi:predicted MFS family arabinose efflux permease
LTCALYGVVALVALPEGAHAKAIHAAPTAEEEAVERRTWLVDPIFVRFLIASTFAAVVYAQMHSTFALQVAARGLPSTTYGALVGLNGLVVLVLELPIASITQRLPKPPVIALAYVLLGIGFGLTGVAPTVWLLGATVVIWTLGEIVGAPVSSAYVSELAPTGQRGRYQGAWNMTFALGYVIGPAAGAALFGWRPQTLWGACLGSCLVGAWLVARSPRLRPAIATSSPG